MHDFYRYTRAIVNKFVVLKKTRTSVIFFFYFRNIIESLEFTKLKIRSKSKQFLILGICNFSNRISSRKVVQSVILKM